MFEFVFVPGCLLPSWPVYLLGGMLCLALQLLGNYSSIIQTRTDSCHWITVKGMKTLFSEASVCQSLVVRVSTRVGISTCVLSTCLPVCVCACLSACLYVFGCLSVAPHSLSMCVYLHCFGLLYVNRHMVFFIHDVILDQPYVIVRIASRLTRQ